MKFNTIMIKIRWLVLLGLWASMQTLKAQHAVVIDSNYIFTGYTQQLAAFRKMPMLPKAVIFVGNSLTDAGRWNDILPEQPVLNRGISGDISYGVLARLEEITRHQPKKIFLMIGVNDLKRNIPTEYIVNNYRRIVQEIRQDSPKTNIYLLSILPVHPDKLLASFSTVKNADVQLLNQGLEKLERTGKKVRFVDLHPVFADENGCLKKELTPDGVHLEVSAYVALINYLKKVKAL